MLTSFKQDIARFRPELLLLISSATMDAEKFSEYFLWLVFLVFVCLQESKCRFSPPSSGSSISSWYSLHASARSQLSTCRHYNRFSNSHDSTQRRYSRFPYREFNNIFSVFMVDAAYGRSIYHRVKKKLKLVTRIYKKLLVHSETRLGSSSFVLYTQICQVRCKPRSSNPPQKVQERLSLRRTSQKRLLLRSMAWFSS